MYLHTFLIFHSDKEPHVFLDIKLPGFILQWKNCVFRA